jgi:type IV secretory pathway VirJ component
VVETAAPGVAALDRLVALVSDVLGARQDDGVAAPEGMSVVPYPSESGSDTMAIIYSGDGGWRDLDKQIGEAIVARGVPVVGVDTLRSFWTSRTPEQMGRDLAELIRTYQARWGTKRVVLIGYSFGADVLPFAINQLPPELRAQIVLVALLAVEPHADFEIHVSGWLGQKPDAQAPEVLPQILKLDLSRLQCFYGEEEEDSLCPAPELAAAEIIRTAGGHHFDGDYAALARRILDGVARRAPGALPAPSATPGP